MSAPVITSDSEHWFEDPERLLHETRLAERLRAVPSITGYEQLAEVSRGGQGVVYRAVQSSTGRTVAIKLPGDPIGTSTSSRRRFEREIDTVARLGHPGIVPVLDSGIALDGRAFLVMPYLEGCPLSDLLDMSCEDGAPAGPELASHPRTWPLPRALEMIAAMCDAVHFAHQRGVIHRDLKPSNIQMFRGTPCILDFGLSRPLDRIVQSSMTLTATGSFLGSLPWASPEQVTGRIDELSTATDIYSLGIIAYQVLTARFPYSVDGSLDSIVRSITTVAPAPPSSHRQEIPPDADAIVLRCLEKDPKNRYPSVAALADDLRRHLAGEPIAAQREQRWRKMQSGLRSARRALAATVLVALVLAGLAYGALHMLQQTARAERSAMQQMMHAQRERARSDAVLRLLSQSLGSLNPADPAAQAMGTRELMRYISARAMTELAHEPTAQMKALLLVGNAQFNLADYHHAEASLRRVDELAASPLPGAGERERSDATFMRGQALRILGMLLHARHDFDHAEEHLRQAYSILSSEDLQSHDNIDWFLISALVDLGTLLAARGRLDEAKDVLELAVHRARACCPESSACSLQGLPLYRLGEVALREGHLELAEERLIAAEQLLESHFGSDSLQFADCLSTQASLFAAQGRQQIAETRARRALAIYTDRLGESHWRTASASISFAETMIADDPHDPAAESLLVEALDTLRSQLGPNHPQCAITLARLGTLFRSRGECSRAVEFYSAAEMILLAVPEHDPVELAAVQGLRACCAGLESTGAEQLTRLKHAVAELQRTLPPNDARLADVQQCLDALTPAR